MPHELMRVRDLLLSRNSLSSFQHWVMILFHIQLFLRSSEGCSMLFDQIVYSLTSLNPETQEVEAIYVKIKGKSDQSFKLMMIWKNNEVPELCLVRHLLAWIQLSKNRTGLLFPDHNGNMIDYNRFNHGF